MENNKINQKKNATWDTQKYLYKSYKNEEALPWVLLGTVLCLVFATFTPLILLIWIYYFYYCYKNNKNLDKDPEILKERKIYEDWLKNK